MVLKQVDEADAVSVESWGMIRVITYSAFTRTVTPLSICACFACAVMVVGAGVLGTSVGMIVLLGFSFVVD